MGTNEAKQKAQTRTKINIDIKVHFRQAIAIPEIRVNTANVFQLTASKLMCNTKNKRTEREQQKLHTTNIKYIKGERDRYAAVPKRIRTCILSIESAAVPSPLGHTENLYAL